MEITDNLFFVCVTKQRDSYWYLLNSLISDTQNSLISDTQNSKISGFQQRMRIYKEK